MPLLLVGIGAIVGWELLGRGDDQSGLSWAAVIKIATVAGAVYLAASALRRA
jgi:hypothetical protein